MEFIKRWIRSVIYEQAVQPSSSPKLGDMFMDAGAAFVAFKIDNGYVMRTYNREAAMVGVSGNSGFTYCADHQAVADHIITTAAKERLGVQGTLDLRAKMTTGAISGSTFNTTYSAKR